MAENINSSSQPQWGRNPKRKVKYAAPKPVTAGGAAPVGPVDDPALIANAATIIKSDRPAPVYSAPAPRASRVESEPDEADFKLRDLVSHMVKGLVDHPEAVDVEIVSAGDGGMLELHVHQDDVGHVIGKQGRTANSLRLTLAAAAGKVDRRVTLEIAD